MAIGIMFLVSVGFIIPGAAVLGALYLGYLAERRTPPGAGLPVRSPRPVRRPRVTPVMEPGVAAHLH